MARKGLIAAAFLLAMLAGNVDAQVPIFKVYGGANAVWFNGPDGLPSDFELGGTARASLSPHISLVGSGFWGLDKSYTIGRGGVRITATDVNDPNFSVGIGAEYQVSTKQDIRPEEWIYTASLGFKPWPQVYPRLIIGAQGAYGSESQQGSLILAARFLLGGL
jgi:hypothetical protein